MRFAKFIHALCLLFLIIHSEVGYTQNSYGWERIYNSIYGIDGSYMSRNTDGTSLWLIRPVNNQLGTGYYDFIRYTESSNSWHPASGSIFKAVYYSYYIGGGNAISGYEYPHCFAVSPSDSEFILINTTLGHVGAPPYDKRLYYSYDNGLSRVDIPAFQHKVFHGISINPVNDSICYATFGDSIIKSADRGANWFRHSALIGFGGRLVINPVDTCILYAVDDSLWISSNGGLNFQVSSEKKFSQFLIGASGLELFATSKHRLYASPDKGFTWIARDSLVDSITALNTDPDNEDIVFAGTSRGLYRSTNSGYSFQFFNNSFSPSRKIQFLCKQPGADYVFVVTEEAVYKCWNSFLVDAEVNSVNIPQEFQLHQNYPNPFNPVTTISYDLPEDGIVTVKVYDILGGEVRTLVNEMKSAGFHSIQFSAEGLAGGTYFLRLQAFTGNRIKPVTNVAVRKMILLK
jgi:hypothetical protein